MRTITLLSLFVLFGYSCPSLAGGESAGVSVPGYQASIGASTAGNNLNTFSSQSTNFGGGFGASNSRSSQMGSSGIGASTTTSEGLGNLFQSNSSTGYHIGSNGIQMSDQEHYTILGHNLDFGYNLSTPAAPHLGLTDAARGVAGAANQGGVEVVDTLCSVNTLSAIGSGIMQLAGFIGDILNSFN